MSLSQENIDKIVFGGVYRPDIQDLVKYCPNQDEPLNDQKYRWWIPTIYTDEKGNKTYYMVDTYQVPSEIFEERYSRNTSIVYGDLLSTLIKCGTDQNVGNAVASSPFNYFYTARIVLSDKNIDIFKLSFNLKDYHIISRDKTKDYKEDDVICGVKLYNDHSYPTGICLVKNYATIDYTNAINHMICDFSKQINAPSYIDSYSITKLKELEQEAISKNGEYDKVSLAKLVEYNEFMEHLTKLHNGFKTHLYKQ